MEAEEELPHEPEKVDGVLVLVADEHDDQGVVNFEEPLGLNAHHDVVQQDLFNAPVSSEREHLDHEADDRDGVPYE